MDCSTFSARRKQCHDVYGNRGEECLNEELTEKRCLSLKHCPREANEYYGDAPMTVPNNGGGSGGGSGTSVDDDDNNDSPYQHHKALCASWAESFAYVDKELEYGPKTVRHHQDARQIVMRDPKLKQECRQIAMNLARCLRRKRLFS
ncbi:hypothetical protein IV203_035710 [Nitzschia inconspicua]|uniref:Uncharacterized protein n=1 Tax=Nitzschia inconspicua TaxID=303405 RepID=A0A9K3PV94_9STRA|nr:hypothetical protein IV203_035710 [Nitzschia inconspicua]